MQNQSLIEFQFEFTDCNGRMCLSDDEGKILSPDDDGQLIVRRRISWPSTIEFEINGKDKFGTQLDGNGSIVRDRAIKLNQISIDGLIPDVNFLKRWPVLIIGGRHSNQIVNSNYFGFNGLIRFEFFANSNVHFMIKTNQFRDNHWNKD